MKKVYKYYFNILCLCCAALGCHAESATDFLGKASQKLQSAPSISVKFTLTGGQGSGNGSMLISGNKFYYDTSEIASWFDGKNLWTLAKRQNEVNLSMPTDAELSEVNPISIIKNFRNSYNASFLKGGTNATKIVKLVPKAKGKPISSAVVSILRSTMLPQNVLLKFSNGQTLTIKVSNIRVGSAVNPNTFVFNKNKFPGVELIDLR